MKNIGIFGGGQLAKMLCIEGYKMGLNFNIYDPNCQACSKSLADNLFQNDFLDKTKISEFIKLNDIFIYEFENINTELLEMYKNKIPQGIDALKILQDRYTEKNFINNLPGIKTVKFFLTNDLKNIETPFLIKSRKNGYDGKGQFIINNIDDIKDNYISDDFIVEEFIDGIEEYSIIMGRSVDSSIHNYAPIKNIHKKGILYESTFSKNLSPVLYKKMINKTKDIMTELDYYGVLCVEFFVKDDNVYVNEVAPRVHNSGHLTFEASNISQFKLHLLCILGLEIPDILSYENYYMINILGQDLKTVEHMQRENKYKNCNFYIYGKNSYDINRKVGHVTFENKCDLLQMVKERIKGTMA